MKIREVKGVQVFPHVTSFPIPYEKSLSYGWLGGGWMGGGCVVAPKILVSSLSP